MFEKFSRRNGYCKFSEASYHFTKIQITPSFWFFSGVILLEFHGKSYLPSCERSQPRPPSFRNRFNTVHPCLKLGNRVFHEIVTIQSHVAQGVRNQNTAKSGIGKQRFYAHRKSFRDGAKWRLSSLLLCSQTSNLTYFDSSSLENRKKLGNLRKIWKDRIFFFAKGRIVLLRQ